MESREDLVETEKSASRARIQSFLFKVISLEKTVCLVATMNESISVH